MATMNFSVPDSVKKQFDREFAHENKSRILTDLMIEAIEQHHLKKQRLQAMEMILKIHANQKKTPVTAAEISAARKAGRK